MKVDLLIKQIAGGNRKAFEKFYNEYYRLVYAVAYSVTRSTPDAEDVASEVFVTIWRKAESYRGGSAKAWICSIVKNHALNFIKKRNRENVALTETHDCGCYSIDEDAEQKITIESALKILSNEERETVLYYNAGLKHREIAEITQTSIGTITWRYNNALKKMRKFLTEGENEK